MKKGHVTRRISTPLGALLVFMTMGLFSTITQAQNWADRINLTGFMSAKYQKIDENNFFNGDIDSGISQDGAFRGTMLGLNLSVPVSSRIWLASQFLATQEDDNYAVHLDWGFVAFGLSDSISLRAGKIKFPTGIVNEYVSVGNAYPWITPPMLFYTEEASGANITREAYSGASGLWEYSTGNTNLTADLFTGEIKLESMHVHKLMGAKFLVDWDEEISLQATYYQGTMRNTTNPAMEGLTHSNIAIGMRLDWHDVVGYAEWSETDMQLEMMNGNVWYMTVGYQIGSWLPHVTYQTLEKGKNSGIPQEQNITTIGFRYDITNTADVKFEYSVINTVKGRGLFESPPENENVGMIGAAVDVVF